MTAKQKRELVFNKYGGRCAYSGTQLDDDWQIDHIIPKRFNMPNADHIDNLVPTQKIINHYKRALPLDLFKSWFLAGLHNRLKKLPKNPRTEKGHKRKQYLLSVAYYFGITPSKQFDGKLYFEKLK